MELAALVALGLTAVVLGLARTELSKVFGRLWYNILEELYFDATQRLTYFPS